MSAGEGGSQPDDDRRRTLSASLRAYAWYFPLSRIYFWAPIFFLYFNERFGVSEVLLLGTVYYVTVSLVELPSGHLSDALGRTFMLRLSAWSMSLSYLLFLVGGESLLVFALAQVLLGIGYASISGTDSAFHYDTLAALDRAPEFPEREARLTRNAQLAGAGGALLAGLASSWALSLAYALSLANAVVLIVLSGRLSEPHREPESWAQGALLPQVRACLSRLRDPYLAWLALFALAEVPLAHVPSELAQPYVALLVGESYANWRSTPILLGAMVAINTFLSAYAVAYSLVLERRLGTANTLLVAVGVHLSLTAAMAAVVSPVVAVLLLLRSSPAALANVLISVRATPRLPQSIRASFLSLISLIGRLGYGGLLALMSLAAGASTVADTATLTRMAWVAVAITLPLVLGLFAWRRALVMAPPALGCDAKGATP